MGGIIGLITNGIAIRMLFRPLHPVKVFGMTLPFTPGIIPKEKSRIAKSCGDVVGTILINEEVLGSTLLSTSMDDKIKGFLNRIIEDHKESEQTIKDVLDRAFTLERRDTYVKKVQHVLSDTFYKKACSLNLGASVADAALEEIKKNPLYDTFSFMISDNAIEGMKGKIQEMVDDMVFDKGEEMITTVVERESEGLLNLTIAELYERFEYQLPRVEDFVLEAYHSLVSSSLSKILKAVDIAKLVEDRINGFDVLELEHIILGIMKKELNAIVWLGGLLGLIMGFIMNLV